ncbi:TlpA disulfide reductase family protein [Bacteroides sp. 224]|uniref:TlpA family protein disulfide reductase n=1 Tax=Bacteroides sp. 224 TaxID=2302936 RepID=UPI0013D080B3|nr:TlpA disulfide reductase family protein [Bacteroides sp. 224]NDV66164.1 TlpA family protein disulfide reductase [Bacteroides sp. 224]
MKQILILSFLVSCLLISCITDDKEIPDNPVDPIVAGDIIPDFKIEEQDGTVLSSDDFAGKRSLFVFFNTWCGDCKRELPGLELAYKELQEDSDFKMAAIARSEDQKATDEYWTTNGYTMTKYHDSNKKIFFAFGGTRVPTLYIIDKDKKVRAVYIEDFKELGDTPATKANKIVALVKAIP